MHVPAESTGSITPGSVFLDDRGRIAQLHGIGLARVADRWYAWGEDKASGGTFTAVACYSSADLVSWRYEGDALTAGEGEIAADRVIERPKVMQRPDGTWLMLLHVDSEDYSFASVGYAVAADPAGPFRYVHSERPLGNISRDIGVYQEDGVGYLLSEDRENGLHIYRLRPDYLGVEEVVATLTQQNNPAIGYESPTLVRHDGLYYLFGSDLTGWSTNDNMFTTAESLEGPWTPWRPFAPVGSATFDSQVSVVVPVGAGHLYVGDRWQRDALAESPAVWLPITLRNGTAELEWLDAWAPQDVFG
ncbi:MULTISPECIES: family 43 glycosylhydrolase [unclassified Microbacterium]|uniref:family 43 glycosylhydrolase n=1 Tax=unclassified Microbacterium TaxID=2609290 RepID=UPI0012FB7D32|nr:family 43 glycosylhydrolase [Microbacterium sp. MAH-37]MVQ41474.1 family 43 glycosylhydrolase [Microbacterium sp. MAH-37]